MEKAALIISLTVGCASNNPKPVTTGVGPQGGVVNGDGATLTIPSGALNASVDITITPTGEAAPAGFTSNSAIYEFEPAGLTFITPIEIRIDMVQVSSDVQLVWSSSAGDSYELKGGTLQGTTLIGQVEHFSHGFAGHATVASVDAAVDPCHGACGSGQVCQAGLCVALTQCNDGIDNDNDGLIDGADPDCAYNGGVSESLPTAFH
jgi:hypothetical protein